MLGPVFQLTVPWQLFFLKRCFIPDLRSFTPCFSRWYWARYRGRFLYVYLILFPFPFPSLRALGFTYSSYIDPTKHQLFLYLARPQAFAWVSHPSPDVWKLPAARNSACSEFASCFPPCRRDHRPVRKHISYLKRVPDISFLYFVQLASKGNKRACQTLIFPRGQKPSALFPLTHFYIFQKLF